MPSWTSLAALESDMEALIKSEHEGKARKCWMCGLPQDLREVIDLWLRERSHNHKRISRFLALKTGQAAGHIYWRLRNHYDANHHLTTRDRPDEQ